MSEPDAPNGAEAPRRRPGRVRRWVVRPFVWGLVVVVAIVGGTLLFFESGYAHRKAKDLLIGRLADLLARDVRVGGVEYDFAPLAFEVHDLIIPGARPGDPDFARVPLLRIEFSWRDLRQRVLRLEQVEVVGAQIYVRFNPDGTTNLPALRPQPKRARRVDVQIGRILVQGGSLNLDELRLPLDLEAQGIWGRLVGEAERGGEGENRLDALLTAQELATTLPNARPYPFQTVSVKGSFAPGRIDIAAARLRGPDVSAAAKGTYRWKGKDRRLDLDLTGDGEARLANRLGYLEQPAEGPFSFQGRFALRGRRWRWSGTARSPRFAVMNRVFQNLEAGLQGDRDLLDVDVVRAGYAGGEVEGTIGVDLRGPSQTAAGRPVDLDLGFSGLALQTLAGDQFPGQDLPLVDEIAGRASGELRYAFRHREPLAGDGLVDLRLAGVRTEEGRIPLSGSATLALGGGMVRSDDIHLTAPSQEAWGTGFVLDLTGPDAGTGRFDFRLASRDAGVLAPLLSDPGEDSFWVPTRGRGTARGEVSILDEGIAARVDLDLRDAASPAVEADSVRGTVAISPRAVEDLRLALVRGDGSLAIAGRIPLEEERRPAQPLSLAVDAVRWPAAGLGYFLPEAVAEPGFLAGRVSGRLDLGGTAEDLNGSGQAEIAGFAVAGQPLGRAQARFGFAGQRITLEQGLVQAPAGPVLIGGSFDGATGRLDFTLDAPSLSLAADPFREALGGDLAGQVAVAAVIGGTTARPEVTARLYGRELALAGRPLGEAGTAEVVADWNGESLQAEGSLLGLISFAGGGPFDRERADLAFRVRSDRLGALVRVAAPEAPDLAGSLLGSVGVTADFASGSYRAALRLADLRLSYEGRTIANLEPVVVALTPERIEIESIYMNEADTQSELFVSGIVGLGGERTPLDLNVQSTISAAWVELLAPASDLEVEGSLDLLATVRGTLDDPVLNGKGELRQARLALPGFPDDFENLQANVTFDRETVSLTGGAEFGRGTLRLTGSLTLPEDFGRPPDRYQLRVEAQDVSLSYEGFSLRGNADLRLRASGADRRLEGEVALARAFYGQNVETDLIRLLANTLRRERLEVPETDEILVSTRLNVRVEGPDALQVRNNVANLRGDVDLTVLGNLASVGVEGEVVLEPGGTLIYNGNEFEVERGRITFNNPFRIDPEIDLTARTEIRSYDILLTASGTLERLDFQYSSDEGLAYLDVLALLTGGQPIEERGLLVPGEERESEVGAGSFLAGQAATALSQRVNTLFGFDRFRIDPVPAESGRVVGGGVQLTLGKRISRDLFVTYTFNPSDSEDYVVRGEWQVSDDVVLVFTGEGRDRTAAIDAQWERRF